jgi:hypothetical protein
VEAGAGSTNTFTVTAVADRVSLDAQRRGLASFTVSNTSDQQRRGRAQVVPLEGAEASWFTVVGDVARSFGPDATEQYPVQIAVPPTAPAGTRSFRLDGVSEDNPDEDTTAGPTVTFEVPAPEAAKKKKFPWWIVALVAVVLIGIAVAVVLITGGDDEPDKPKARPAAAFAGVWVNPDSTSDGIDRLAITVKEDTLTFAPSGCPNIKLGRVPRAIDRAFDRRPRPRCRFAAQPTQFKGEPVLVNVTVNFGDDVMQTRQLSLELAKPARDSLRVTETRQGDSFGYSLDKQKAP